MDMLPSTSCDVADLWRQLLGFVESFTNPHLKLLLTTVLDDPALALAYREAPAAKQLHHAWLGGLLEHVISLCKLADHVAPHYPLIDRDLLMTGVILHDIGKVRELSWGSTFSYTLEGQMIGHISIAQGMLQQKIAAMPDFPDKLRVLVEHMILSHHGKYEFGSPKLPMTPEAILLSALDDIEAKMQAMRNEFNRDVAAGKTGAEMTEWVRSMERPLLNSRAYLDEEKASQN
jgi:3'-5' exoribonuclease